MNEHARIETATAVVPAEPLAAAVGRAAAVLSAGGLVAVPTETVYGLAALAALPSAVARLYAAKGRPASNPLIVHVADATAAWQLGTMTPAAKALAAAFWPGPLTLVLPLRPGAPIAPAALAGGDTVAVRVPADPLVRALAAAVGPLVAPSANRSGRVSSTTAAAVMEELAGRIDLVIDGGASAIGVESTVVDAAGAPRVLRPGAIGAEAVADALAAAGVPAGTAAPEPVGILRSPGLLASHYAPRARVRLDVTAADVEPDEAWLAFGSEPSRVPPERTFRLSPSGDLAEAARNLYAGLRALDATGAAAIAVSPIPATGIGAAIRDRLARAASPRPSTDTGQR
jgi:L-threonylcarbamoyladenylate synthase